MLEYLMQIDWSLLVKIFMPVLVIMAAAVVLILDSDDPESNLPFIIAILGLVISLLASWYLWPSAQSVEIAVFIFNRTVLVSWMFVVFSVLISLLLFIPYAESVGDRKRRILCLVLLSTIAACLTICANDLIMAVVAIEMLSATLIFSKNSKYFIISLLSLALILVGSAFIFGGVGSTSLDIIKERSLDVVASGSRNIYFIGVIFVIIGLVSKLFMFLCIPLLEEKLFLANAMAIAIFMFLVRFISVGTPIFGVFWRYAGIAICLSFILLGSLLTLRESNLRRMISFSWIAQFGFAFIVLPSFNIIANEANAAILSFIFYYVIMLAGCNACSDSLHKKPLGKLIFTVILLSIAGLPPTFGFFARGYLFATAIKAGDLVLVVASSMVSLILLYCYLRPVALMYFSSSQKSLPSLLSNEDLPHTVFAVIVLAVIVITVLGVMPDNLFVFVRKSVF